MDRFTDPRSPDYAGPTEDFSEAGFAEVLEALDAPEDTPERRATFDGARMLRSSASLQAVAPWPEGRFQLDSV